MNILTIGCLGATDYFSSVFYMKQLLLSRIMDVLSIKGSGLLYLVKYLFSVYFGKRLNCLLLFC